MLVVCGLHQLGILRERTADAFIVDEVIIVALSFIIFDIDHLFVTVGRGEVGKKQEFVVGDFGEFLREFHEVMIFYVYASTVADHDEGRIELPDLIEQKILDNETYEVALMILNVFFLLEDLWKFLVEDRHTQGKHVYVLIKVIMRLLILVLIKLLSSTVVVLRVEVESIHASQHLVVLIHCIVIVAFIQILTVAEHQFFEEPT